MDAGWPVFQAFLAELKGRPHDGLVAAHEIEHLLRALPRVVRDVRRDDVRRPRARQHDMAERS